MSKHNRVSIYSLPPHITALVCSHLRTKAARRSLAALATTCRLIQDVALDALWYSIEFFIPLFYTFPPDLCYIVSFLSYQINFVREAVPTDFIRFRSYAARVVEICDNPQRAGLHVEPTVWDQLERYHHHCAFPRLRSIAYGGSTFKCTAYRYPVHLAFGPSLVSLRLVLNESPSGRTVAEYRTAAEVHLQVVEWLGVASNLQTLVLEKGKLNEPYSTVPHYLALPLATVIAAGLTSLTTITIPDIPLLPSAFSKLASLASLASVTIYALSDDYLWEFSSEHGPLEAAFAGVEHLSLRSDSFDWCVALLRTAAFDRLRTLRVATEDIVQPQLLQAFAEALSVRPYTRNRITEVDLELGQLSNNPLSTPVPIYLGADIVAFYALPALTSLTISGHCHAILDDDALEALSRAWPSLARLHLQPARDSKDAQIAISHPHPHHTRGTLLGLLSLAERCHHLRMLGVELDFTRLLSETELRRAFRRLAGQDGLRHPLETLSVGWSRLGNRTEVAMVLSAWFPRLTGIWNPHPGRVRTEEQWLRAREDGSVRRMPPARQDGHRKWNMVFRLAQRFVKVRAQERKWRAAQDATHSRD